MKEQHPVAKPSPRYLQLQEKRKLPRTLMGGTAAMRKAGKEYMPQHPAESVKVYKTRLENTILYRGFEDGVTKQASKLFGEPIVEGEDVPPTIAELCKNIDGQGRAVTTFAFDLAKEGFVDGISFILVDFPKLQPTATMADQQRVGARPYWVLIKADQLIDIQTENIAGQQTPTQVRIYECTYERKGEFEQEEVERIRVFTPTLLTVWRKYKNEKGEEEWRIEESTPMTLGKIPLVPFYTNRIGFMEGEPPLASLADLNWEHWISSSEQRNALTFLRFAMLALTGVEKKDDVQVGPSKTIYLPVGGDAKYVEHSGKGIDAGAADLESIEKKMQTAGMQIRVENQGEVTATCSAIDSAESNAGMRAVAKSLKDAVEGALQLTADWLKIPKGGTVTVYDKFGEVPPEVTMDQLRNLRKDRELSRPTFWSELQKRNLLSEDFDPEAEAELLEEETAKELEAQREMMKEFGTPPMDGEGDPPPSGPPGSKSKSPAPTKPVKE